MHEVLANPEQVPFFQAAVDGQDVDWDTFFAEYPSAVDWPVSCFWQTLAERYPAAKVILTIRDAESWWRSFSKTILVQIQTPTDTFENPQFAAVGNMVDKLIVERVFGCAPDDKDAVLRRYQQYIEEVQKSLPPERLLTMDIGEGWDRLCEFLGLPIPDEPYPLLNTTRDYAKEKLD